MTELELIRKAQAAYKRDWNRKNPGKNKEYIQRFWLRKAKELQLHKNSEGEESDGDGADANTPEST